MRLDVHRHDISNSSISQSIQERTSAGTGLKPGRARRFGHNVQNSIDYPRCSRWRRIELLLARDTSVSERPHSLNISLVVSGALAHVAQRIERLPPEQKVGGPIPLEGTSSQVP